MNASTNTLKDYIKKMKNYRLLSPLFYLGKKYLYNPYLSSKLNAFRFPSEVWIENTNVCNAHCVMCPRDSHTRKLGFMDFSLYEKLIKEISSYKESVERVHLHNYGEPLLDKKLPERIKLAKKYGIKHLYLVTNASLLPSELSEKIITAGLDEFKVSFYGTDKKTYNETMKGLDFDRTIQNIKDFFVIRKEKNALKPRVIIQYLPQTSNRFAIKSFTDIFEPIINKDIGDSLNIFSLHNYGGGKDFHEIKEEKACNICGYPWRTMVILHDGRVVICCIDFNGIQVVGDVNKNTIEEIWNGETYRKIREDFKRLKYENYPTCMQCDIIRE
jgi:radical SAM protein with 4Fe4S-binding SPASM domain